MTAADVETFADGSGECDECHGARVPIFGIADEEDDSGEWRYCARCLERMVRIAQRVRDEQDGRCIDCGEAVSPAERRCWKHVLLEP